MKTTFTATLASMMLLCLTSLVPADTVKQIGIVLPPDAGPLMKNIAAVFARQVGQRCEAKTIISDEAPLKVEFVIEPGIGSEGFKIADGPDGSVRIIGNDEQGLLYGVGKFLRTSRYDRGGFTAGDWRGISVPACPFRSIALNTYWRNFFVTAPTEEVQRYIEDLSLWGLNAVSLHFPHWQFQGFDDPAARKSIQHLHHIMKLAKEIGVKVGLAEAANAGFKSTPKELHNTPFPDPLKKRGNFWQSMLCPSNPKARAVLLENWVIFMNEFADIGLDYFVYWPYDAGGCGCKDCWPWGARGYPNLCREYSTLARVKHPQIQFILSTWCFDTPPAGEWEGLAEFLAKDKSWVDYIMADSHTDFPRYPLENGSPGGLPLVNFPEISMWGMWPWGGYGANPFPGRLQRLWNQTQRKLSGGAPYSEGIYEDINKAICLQFYWNPDQPAADTVKEYVAFEFSPDVVDDIFGVIQILEKNHARNKQHLHDHGIGPSAVRAHELAKQAEAKLTPKARNSWRWRILYLRVLIDRELFNNGGRLEGKVLKEAFDELADIYHVNKYTSSCVRPPNIRLAD